jgi:hypothetical protein
MSTPTTTADRQIHHTHPSALREFLSSSVVPLSPLREKTTTDGLLLFGFSQTLADWEGIIGELRTCFSGYLHPVLSLFLVLPSYTSAMVEVAVVCI